MRIVSNSRSMLRLVDMSLPPEQRSADIGLHMAQAVPDDRGINIIEYGTTRIEALEKLVVEIDRATAKLYEARNQAMEIIQTERRDASDRTEQEAWLNEQIEHVVDLSIEELLDQMRSEELEKIKKMRGTHLNIILAEEARKLRRKEPW